MILIATPASLKCDWCLKVIRANSLFIKHSAKKYFHVPCHEEYKMNNLHRNQLLDYIIELQGYKKLAPKLFAQIKDYQERFDFKFKGIELTLRYFHEIKGNLYEDQGIGIVPYYYEEAQRFYYKLADLTQLATDSEYNLQEETVYIHEPAPLKHKKKLVNIEEIIE